MSIEGRLEAAGIETEPVAALMNRAEALAEEGDVAGAIEVLDGALARTPSDAGLLARRGAFRAEQGQLAEAIRDLAASVMLDPKDYRVLDSLAGHLRDMKMFDQAVVFQVKAINAAPAEEQPRLYLNLGLAMVGLENHAAAIELFEEALKARPDLVEAAVALSGSYLAQREFEKAAAAVRRTLQVVETSSLYQALGTALQRMPGKLLEATAAFERAVALDPDNRVARHRLALLRGDPVEEMPGSFARALFDEQARTYDKDAIEKQRYRVPGLVRKHLMAELKPGERFGAVLDLGSGTGLIGVVVRELTDYLRGVEISPAMAAQALDKEVYDRIELADIHEGWTPEDRPVDVVVAADLFPYLGRPDRVFQAVQAQLRPGGLFLFTVERGWGDRFGLSASGRFWHSRAYVEQALRAAGFTVALVEETVLRVNAGIPVHGFLFVARRP